MNRTKLSVLTLTIILSLNSCLTKNKVDNNKPNFELASKYGIDSTQLVYQYYQKFGFTETCEQIRMVSKSASKTNFDKNLPFSVEDIKTINNNSDQKIF